MNTLTPRQQFILSELINKKSCNAEVLHNELAISVRTILREIASINKILKDYKLTILYYENMNLIISGEKQNIKKLENLISSIPILWLYNKEQRKIVIVCELLLEEGYLKESYFSYKFNVVMGSISQDLDSIEKMLLTKNLYLMRKRTYGIKINGSEWNKRNAFIEMFFNFKPFEYLFSFIYGDKVDNIVQSFFKDIFQVKTIDIVKEIFHKLDFGDIKVNDVQYFNLFILTLLAIKKTEDGSNISLPDKIKQDMENSKIYKKLKLLQEELSESNITLPEDELAYLCLYLNDYKYNNVCNKSIIESDINYECISKELINAVSKKIEIDITKDKKLLEDLSQHLKQTFHMLNLGLDIINTLVNEIKEHYSKLFDIINNECRLIFSRYNIKIPEEEIGYITMHIEVAIQGKQAFVKKLDVLIVCISGISTAKILNNKVKNLFSDIGNTDITSIHDLYDKLSKNEYDLILSTVPISLGMDNVIVVSPFMTKENVDEVKDFIFRIKMKKQNLTVNYSDNLSFNELNEEYELINEIFKNLKLKKFKVNTFNELIDCIADDIYESNISRSKEEIKRLILKREEKGNVVVPKSGMALLHTRSDEMIKPFVGVYYVDKYFPMSSEGFSTENVNAFLVLLARNNESDYVLQFLGKISISLIEREGFVETLKTGNIRKIRSSLICIANKEDDVNG
ncbi:BglG family transcription antiterminator [Clostridium neuense]|uniref:BglG family transcription antiterminator n=1 Tax=Clostridium neuense TaxID=1728934 RepID=A0ABW8TGW5_9CLOT